MLRNVHLHGRLGKRFGKTHSLDVQTPAEAIRALCVTRPGFEAQFRKGQYAIRVGDDRPVEMGTLRLGLGATRDVHIFPAGMVAGIETVLLVGTLVLSVASVALSLFMMPKAPSASSREDQTKTDSFIFDGPENVIEQGHRLPLIYGRMRVGSLVASAGISTADVNQSSVSDSGSVGTTPGITNSPAGDEWVVVEKGKAGGAARAAEEDPNTLQSQATVRIIDVLGEGEIGGLVDGLKSIYLDKVPIQNPDGSYNFSGLHVTERVGLPDQDHIPGYPAAEATVSVDQEVKVSTGPVEYSVTDSTVDAVRVTILLPQLFRQDTTNGDVKQTNVEFGIDVRAGSGGWTETVHQDIFGKTNSGYQRSFEIRSPGSWPWSVRVRRVTPDNDLASLSNAIRFDLATELVDAKFSYPDTALIGITADARQFGSNIPARAYEVYGLIIDVPSNYDPATRTYTGVWDGTFKRAWSDNPAWVFRDIVVNRRYGLGERVPPTLIDKWGLYAIAQYCDQMVPDGTGGQEPRYTINAVIKSEARAYDVIASIASCFRGWAYWSTSGVVAIQDRPEDPSVLVTRANVVDGQIEYGRATDLDQRRSVVIMYWNDPNDNYRLVPEVVERDSLIRRFGWRPGDPLTAFGCTSRGQARRMAAWVFEDEGESNATAKYQAGDDHGFVEPGRIAQIADPMFTEQRRGGRIKSATANSVTLDHPVTIPSGTNSYLRVVLPTGAVVRRQITDGSGERDLIHLGGAPFAATPLAGAVWQFESDAVANRQFRIRSITADGPPYDVEAQLYDPTKFERVEQGVSITPQNYLQLPTGGLEAPSGLAIIEYIAQEGDATVPCFTVSWRPVQDPRVTYYQAQYQRPGGQFEKFADGLDTSRDIRGTIPGAWAIRVRAVDSLGRKTEWVQRTFTLAAAQGPVPNVTGLQLLADADALTPLLAWAAPSDPRALRYRVYFNSSANDLSAAQMLGETDALRWPVQAPGHYWVQAFYSQAMASSPPHLQITATMFADVKWSRVLGRPVSLNDLDSVAAAALAQAQSDIDDLFATYGSTSSAATSAADAATSAALALARANAAATSASAASGYASTAQTNADAAAGSASAAQASAVYSSSVAGSLRPSTFEQGNSWWRTPWPPSWSTADGYSFTTVSPYGVVALSDTGNRPIAPKDPLPIIAGKKYRMTVVARAATTATGNINVRMGAWSADDSNTLIDNNAQNTANDATITVGAAPATFTWTVGMPGTSGCDVTLSSGATRWVPHFRFNRGNETAQPGMMLSFRIEDVTSELAAAAQATAAATSASAASTSATSAGTSASAASTSATSANTSAGQASTYASNASSSATGAANSASAASSSATAASTSAGSASTSASTASTQASVATAQAAAAQMSAVLAASVSLRSINSNPTFADYPTTPGEPTNWLAWGHDGGAPTRITGKNGAGYALRESVGANLQQGGSQSNGDMVNGIDNGWYVLEAEVKLVSGTLRGAGVWVNCGSRSTGAYLSDLGGISFAADPDSTGNVVGAGVAGRVYRFSKLLHAPASFEAMSLYRMTNWDGFGTRDAKTLDWYQCSIRAATQQEIRDQTVLVPLQATVTTQAGTIATLQGKLQAYLSLVAAAGSSVAAVRLVADSYAGSLLELQADAIRLGAANQPAMSIVGSDVRFHGKVDAGSITAESLASTNVITDSAQISNLVVKSANIDDLTIGTGKLSLNSVTRSASVYTSGSQSTGSSYSNAQSLSYSCQGYPVLLNFSCAIDTTNVNGVTFVQILRDGSLIWGELNYGSNGGFKMFSTSLIDSPGFGSHNYELQVKGGSSFRYRTIAAVEVLR